MRCEYFFSLSIAHAPIRYRPSLWFTNTNLRGVGARDSRWSSGCVRSGRSNVSFPRRKATGLQQTDRLDRSCSAGAIYHSVKRVQDSPGGDAPFVPAKTLTAPVSSQEPGIDNRNHIPSSPGTLRQLRNGTYGPNIGGPARLNLALCSRSRAHSRRPPDHDVANSISNKCISFRQRTIDPRCCCQENRRQGNGPSLLNGTR